MEGRPPENRGVAPTCPRPGIVGTWDRDGIRETQPTSRYGGTRPGNSGRCRVCLTEDAACTATAGAGCRMPRACWEGRGHRALHHGVAAQGGHGLLGERSSHPRRPHTRKTLWRPHQPVERTAPGPAARSALRSLEGDLIACPGTSGSQLDRRVLVEYGVDLGPCLHPAQAASTAQRDDRNTCGSAATQRFPRGAAPFVIVCAESAQRRGGAVVQGGELRRLGLVLRDARYAGRVRVAGEGEGMPTPAMPAANGGVRARTASFTPSNGSVACSERQR